MQRRNVLPLLIAGAIASSFLQCHKEPPQENVYTGAKTRGPTGDAGTIKPFEDDAGPPPGGFTKAGLLKAMADCAVDRYRELDVRARALKDAARAYRDDRTEEKKKAAQDAWRAAMAAAEEADLFRIGPSAPPPALGARSMRDEIYSWPFVSRCRVDEQIVSKIYERPELATSLVNGRGLAAFEYLAFYGGSDNGCSGSSAINANGTWAALGTQEIALRKPAYAAAVADDVAARASALLAAWDPASGNFHKELATAGAGSATYPTQQDAFNAITHSLFYLDLEVKDLKLGKPLGFIDCATSSCPEAVESPYARTSAFHIKANLSAARRIFQGCGDNYAGLGFDDWLREVGAGDVVGRLLGALVQMQTELEPISSLEDTLASDRTKLERVHAAARALGSSMKTELVTVLNLELPKSLEGDND